MVAPDRGASGKSLGTDEGERSQERVVSPLEISDPEKGDPSSTGVDAGGKAVPLDPRGVWQQKRFLVGVPVGLIGLIFLIVTLAMKGGDKPEAGKGDATEPDAANQAAKAESDAEGEGSQGNNLKQGKELFASCSSLEDMSCMEGKCAQYGKVFQCLDDDAYEWQNGLIKIVEEVVVGDMFQPSDDPGEDALQLENHAEAAKDFYRKIKAEDKKDYNKLDPSYMWSMMQRNGFDVKKALEGWKGRTNTCMERWSDDLPAAKMIEVLYSEQLVKCLDDNYVNEKHEVWETLKEYDGTCKAKITEGLQVFRNRIMTTDDVGEYPDFGSRVFWGLADEVTEELMGYLAAYQEHAVNALHSDFYECSREDTSRRCDKENIKKAFNFGGPEEGLSVMTSEEILSVADVQKKSEAFCCQNCVGKIDAAVFVDPRFVIKAPVVRFKAICSNWLQQREQNKEPAVDVSIKWNRVRNFDTLGDETLSHAVNLYPKISKPDSESKECFYQGYIFVEDVMEGETLDADIIIEYKVALKVDGKEIYEDEGDVGGDQWNQHEITIDEQSYQFKQHVNRLVKISAEEIRQQFSVGFEKKIEFKIGDQPSA